MLGAIIGDIVGSRFERHNHKSKDFDLFTDRCRFTDDTAMTVAVAKALLECKGDYYILDFAIDEIRPKYRFDASCQGSVPQAIEAFLESENFEDTIRIAVSLGGDSDTIAAIAGGIAGAYYGVPNDLRLKAIEYLPAEFIDILEDFEKNYC